MDPLRQSLHRPNGRPPNARRAQIQESALRALHEYEQRLIILGTTDLETALADLGPKATLAQTLQRLLKEKGLKRASVIAAAGINATFGYQIFVGQRNASRNKLLALCVAMGLDLKQANTLLRSGGVNELFSGDRRDAIVVYGLLRRYPLQKVQEDLYRFGELMLG